MLKVTHGSLVLVDTNTTSPKVFWNGILVEGIVKIVVRNDEDDADVKFVVERTSPIIEEMIAAKINVKVRGHNG